MDQIRPGCGIPLHPDRAYLERIRPILETGVDFVELSPEALWTVEGGSREAREFFLELREQRRFEFVAHALTYSVGTEPIAGDGRQARWLERFAEDQAEFEFAWASVHLGFAAHGEQHVALPLPLPNSQEAAAVVAANLRRLGEVVPKAAFENWAGLFSLDDALRDGLFFRSICDQSGGALLLDLHNVYTHARNAGIDPDEYLDGIVLDDVLEIHLSGGSESDPRWLASGRSMRLDSHDGAVPEWVWEAAGRVVPRCPNLRCVLLERIPESLRDEHVPAFLAEFDRLRGLLC